MATAATAGTIPKRYILVALCFAATFICYIDRVNISVAIIPMAEQFGWDGRTKGLVLSSFFVGYLLAMVPGGMLANRFGGKTLLGGALVGWSLFTLLTPLAAAASLAALLLVRIGMGLGEAATFPAAINLFARWLPESERSRAVTINLAGIPLGTVFGLTASAALVTAYGWPSVFYIFGAGGLLFALLWFRAVHAAPAVHPAIGDAEARLLAEKVAALSARAAPIPWRKLFAQPAVWALLANHFASTWALYLMLTWLPSYFRDAQHLDIAGAGLFSVGPWLSLFAVGTLGGIFADRQVARGTDLTRVRKGMQVSGLLGSAAGLLLAAQAATPAAALVTLCLSLGALGLTWSGFAANHLDIAPRHADVLYGITNTAGTLPGIVGVYATGLLLDLTGGYTATFVLAAAVNVAGAAIFIVWGTARRVVD